MKKYIKTSIICLILFTLLIFTTQVYAELGNGLNNQILENVTANKNDLVNDFSSTLKKVFGSLFLILKILGVAGIVINGVKYMYADSQDKAKIKQSLVYIIIGTVFIFGADIVVNLIEKSWENTATGL